MMTVLLILSILLISPICLHSYKQFRLSEMTLKSSYFKTKRHFSMNSNDNQLATRIMNGLQTKVS